MHVNLVRHISPEDFVMIADLEIQVVMYETLLATYSPTYLPDWANKVRNAVCGDPTAMVELLNTYEYLAPFALCYRTQQHSGDHFGDEQLLLEQEHADQCAAEEYWLQNHQEAA